jgi:opacity protein-like surface antigen
MKKSLVVISVILLFTMVAAATDLPQAETFLGYSYVRFNTASHAPSFSASGGDGQFAWNFGRCFSAVADLGAVHNGNINSRNIDSTFMNFLFGPRVRLNFERLRPYFNVLFGGVYAASSTKVVVLPGAGIVVTDPNTPITARIIASQTAFAMTAGGGLDIKINRHLMFRPIGVDYYLTRLQNLRTLGDNNQGNLRYTAGLNFTFGKQ